MLWLKVSPSTLMFLPEASWKPLSAWQARQSVCATIEPGSKASDSETRQPTRKLRKLRCLTSLTVSHPTAPELLRLRFAGGLPIRVREGMEEAVHAALLILASSFSRRRMMIPSLQDKRLAQARGEIVCLTGVALLRK